jgi:raffinose/stachyose/melibiose transport system permease protein
MNLYYSVFDWNGISSKMTYVGLDNFVKIFTGDRMFVKSALFTARYACIMSSSSTSSR